MKTRIVILFILCVTFIIWGCKKDSIIDNQPSEELPDTLPEQLPDSLDWNDSIGGSYQLYGITGGSYLQYDTSTGGYHYVGYSDTVESVMHVTRTNDSTIIIQMDNSSHSIDIELVSLNTDSSTYQTYDIPGSGLNLYNLKFINNDTDSVYYTKTETQHTGGGIIKLAGIRIP